MLKIRLCLKQTKRLKIRSKNRKAIISYVGAWTIYMAEKEI